MGHQLSKKIITFIVSVIIVSIVILVSSQIYAHVIFPAKQDEIRNYYNVMIVGSEIAPRSAAPGYFYIVYAYDMDECIYRTFEMDDWTGEPGRSNTSDWYGAILDLEKQKTPVRIQTRGERAPDLSEYPNIIWIEGLYTRADGRLTDLLW